MPAQHTKGGLQLIGWLQCCHDLALLLQTTSFCNLPLSADLPVFVCIQQAVEKNSLTVAWQAEGSLCLCWFIRTTSVLRQPEQSKERIQQTTHPFLVELMLLRTEIVPKIQCRQRGTFHMP